MAIRRNAGPRSFCEAVPTVQPSFIEHAVGTNRPILKKKADGALPPGSIYLCMTTHHMTDIFSTQSKSTQLFHILKQKLGPSSILEKPHLELEWICDSPCTLPETNIAPENRPSQKETTIPTIHFQVLC